MHVRWSVFPIRKTKKWTIVEKASKRECVYVCVSNELKSLGQSDLRKIDRYTEINLDGRPDSRLGNRPSCQKNDNKTGGPLVMWCDQGDA